MDNFEQAIAEMQAMVDERLEQRKKRLQQIRTNMNDVIAIARGSDSLTTAWFLLGVQASAIDAILAELIGDDARAVVPEV